MVHSLRGLLGAGRSGGFVFACLTLAWLAILSPKVPAQASTGTIFFDDFDDGAADGWDLGEGWQVVFQSDSYVLEGQEHFWAIPDAEGRADYTLGARVQVLAGGVHFVFRMLSERLSDADIRLSRYFLGIRNHSLYLRKQVGSQFTTLYEDFAFTLPTDAWAEVRIVLRGGVIVVLIDGTQVLEVEDSQGPLLFGGFAFECLGASHVRIDDVYVEGSWFVEPIEGYRWIRLGGPSGGLGYDVRIHPTNPDIMFVTDNPSGVNKSYNGGAEWVQRNEGITNRTGPSLDGLPIFSLTIDPNNPNIVWAGTQDGRGIYKSTDGGESWVKKDNGVTESDSISFRGFGVRPGNSSVVIGGAEINTGVRGTEFGKNKGKIYKTMDGGENWYAVWNGDSLARFILFDPSNPSNVYASTGIFDREAWSGPGVGVLKSIDGGENWGPINNGIPATDGNRFVGFLEMHPSNPQVLFAASGNNAAGGGGIFRTTDSGTSWQTVLSGDIFSVVTFSPTSPTVVYAGSADAFYRSEDGGDTWQKYQNAAQQYGPPGIRAGVPISAVVHPNDPYTIFANNYQGGNFKSTDGAQTWVNASRGYTGAHVHDIAMDRHDPGRVFAIGRSGPFRSLDAGESWQGIAFSPAIQPEWYAVALHPEDPNEVLISDEFTGHIYKTADAGDSWREVFNHPQAGANPSSPTETRHGFKDIVHAPSNPLIVYAGMSKGRRTIDGDFPPRGSFGMYKSTDGGENWGPINGGLESAYLLNVLSIAVHPSEPNVAYIGTWTEGVYKTTNGGGQWVRKSDGLLSGDVRALAIDPDNPDVVYAGLGEGAGVYKTTNGGDLWGAINEGIPIECPAHLLPIGRAPLGFSTEGIPPRRVGGDYYSVPWTSVWAIAIDPTDPRTVYAGDHRSGVYLSTDAGAHWQPINEGLTMRAVTELEISLSGRSLYAATEGGGVFRLEKPIASTRRWPMFD